MRGHVFNGILMIILSVLLAILFAGCSWQKNKMPELSGTYYLIDDIWKVTEASITFSGDNFTLLVNGEKLEGKMLYDRATTTNLEDGGEQANVPGVPEDWYSLLISYSFSDQKEIYVDFPYTIKEAAYSGAGRFVKKASIANLGWIIAVIVLVVLAAIGTLYKKRTGRNLSDDTGKVINKVTDKVGNIINSNDKNDGGDDKS